MEVSSKRQLANRLKKELAENVLVIHQVEEREARVDTGSGKHLEEGRVLVVIGVAVASAAKISSTQPRLRGGIKFVSCFDGNCAGPMSEHSPVANLGSAPKQE